MISINVNECELWRSLRSMAERERERVRKRERNNKKFITVLYLFFIYYLRLLVTGGSIKNK